MTKTKARDALSVNKSISLPFTLLEQVLDESELMGKSFSEAVVVLVRIGLSQRSIQRAEEKKYIEDRARYDMK